MSEAYYVVDSLCVVIIAAIIISEALTFFKNRDHRDFFIMICMMALLFIDEIFAKALYAGDIHGDSVVFWFSYIAYYELLVAIIALWTRHCGILLGLHNRYALVTVVFYLILLAIVLTTPITGLFAEMDGSENIVQRMLYMPIMILALLPAVIVTGYAMIASLRSRDAGSREQNFTLAVVLLPVLVFFFIELETRTIPLFSVGLVISSLSVYIVMKKQMITTDRLTGIMNKNTMDGVVTRLMDKFDSRNSRSAISEKIHHELIINNPVLSRLSAFGERKHLYLLMMDMNHFKSINDNYGHAEGDVALRDFAHILNRSCEGTEFIPGRYAGDEFVVFGECDDLSEIEALMERIHSGCAAMKKPYEFGTSIGYAEYNPEYKTFKEFLKVADERMFQAKEASRKKA